MTETFKPNIPLQASWENKGIILSIIIIIFKHTFKK